jgi:hypothetical protein
MVWRGVYDFMVLARSLVVVILILLVVACEV